MAIGISGHGYGGMPHYPLKGLGVHPSLDAQDVEGLTEIMEPEVTDPGVRFCFFVIPGVEKNKT